eukprot:g41811.t1
MGCELSKAELEKQKPSDTAKGCPGSTALPQGASDDMEGGKVPQVIAWDATSCFLDSLDATLGQANFPPLELVAHEDGEDKNKEQYQQETQDEDDITDVQLWNHSHADQEVCDFPSLGVSAFFIAYFATFEVGSDQTIQEVVEEVVKPRTADGHLAYTQLLQRSNSKAVGPPTYVLSHVWSYKLADVVKAILKFCEDEMLELEETFFWFDIFSTNQHHTGPHQEGWLEAYENLVGEVGQTLLVAAPWNKPLPLTRTWNLWEMVSTVVQGGRLAICLAPSEEEKMFDVLLCDAGALKMVCPTVDVEKSEAFNQHDRVALLSRMRQLAGPISRINQRLQDVVNEWLAHTALSHLRDLKGEGRLPVGALLHFTNIIDRFLTDSNESEYKPPPTKLC